MHTRPASTADTSHAETDTEAFMRDMISITPILPNWKTYAMIDELRKRGLGKMVQR